MKLNAEQLLILAELIEASDDATLEELRYLLYPKIGFTISVANDGKNGKTLKHDFKKTLFPIAKGTDRVQKTSCESALVLGKIKEKISSHNMKYEQ
ncbi:hypothetical protein QUA03_06545, partial [Microcoleus sp. S36b_A4]|uniref:hypothetical protein n=1 Tax=Microcoleus sp. S36b_A4 TaxID=3055420 RepID=UPI003B0B80E1